MKQREKKTEREIKNAKQEKEVFARRLLAKGMDPDFVAESTDLTKEKVMEIKTRMQK